jgi:iron complex transport system substrate-binding protein
VSRTYPNRIACLSAECADLLYRLGAWNRVAGITAYYQPPPGAAPRPVVSGFSKGSIERIARLKPDLVITFSDVQADLTAQLLRAGLPVLATNQRSIGEIEDTILLIARLVGRERQGKALLRKFRAELKPVKPRSPRRQSLVGTLNLKHRTRVYFEEWNDPLISGIAWVGELIERAGGSDVFAELACRRRAPDRVVTAAEVIRRNPQVIIASWCGKPADLRRIAARPGWDRIDAVRNGRLHEIPARYILQPGYPLIVGYRELKRIVHKH